MSNLLRNMSMFAVLCAMAGCGGGGGSSTPQINSTYRISGSVTSEGAGVQGATVLLGGTGSAIAFTNSSGNYSFTGLPNGKYTVTPMKPSYSCFPRMGTYQVQGGNVTKAEFTARPSSTIFYVVDEHGQIATLDIATKQITILGTTALFLNDIAFAPGGDLYGVSVTDLYKIDKTTAAATLVGPLGILDSTSLEFGTDGTLYTANAYLYTLNTSTGAAKMVGAGGTPYHSSGDLVFLGNQMYLTSNKDSSSDVLLKLNPVTGSASLVGPVGFEKVYGLATNDNVTLYGFTDNKVITIDPTTGAGTLLWDFSGRGLAPIDGAAASPW